MAMARHDPDSLVNPAGAAAAVRPGNPLLRWYPDRGIRTKLLVLSGIERVPTSFSQVGGP